GTRGGRGAGNEGALQGVAAGNLPAAGQRAVDSELKAVGALAASLHDSRRVVRIGGARVRSIQPVRRDRDRELSPRVPFRAELVIAEFLRPQLLRDGGQGREL